MRRQELQRERDFAMAVIDKCRFMTLSISCEGAPPYAIPLSPVRQGDFIYFHCATEGRKSDLLRLSPQVSMVFVGDTQEAPGAFTLFYESAVATGTAAEVTDEVELVEALRLLCLTLCPDDMADFPRVLAAWRKRTAVWKISLEHVTAKSNFPHR